MGSFLWRLSARSIDCMKSGPRADPTLLGLRVDIMLGGWRWKSSPGLLDFCLMSTRPQRSPSVGPAPRRRSGGPEAREGFGLGRVTLTARYLRRPKSPRQGAGSTTEQRPIGHGPWQVGWRLKIACRHL